MTAWCTSHHATSPSALRSEGRPSDAAGASPAGRHRRDGRRTRSVASVQRGLLARRSVQRLQHVAHRCEPILGAPRQAAMHEHDVVSDELRRDGRRAAAVHHAACGPRRPRAGHRRTAAGRWPLRTAPGRTRTGRTASSRVRLRAARALARAAYPANCPGARQARVSAVGLRQRDPEVDEPQSVVRRARRCSLLTSRWITCAACAAASADGQGSGDARPPLDRSSGP